ncbi:hypothetical protein IAT38_000200 [Cryptococcus sp. DSM 104549]
MPYTGRWRGSKPEDAEWDPQKREMPRSSAGMRRESVDGWGVSRPLFASWTRGRRRRRGSLLDLLPLLLVCLLISLPGVVSQSTSSTSSGTSSATTAASSTTTRSSTTSASTTSASSTTTATPTLSLTSLPTTLSLPPLNTSHPLLQLSLPSSSSLYLTFSLCSLTSNTSLLPTVLLSTSSPPSFPLGSKSVSSPSSGGYGGSGLGYNRRSSKSGSTWRLTWSYGFGNWTYGAAGGADEVEVGVLLGLGLDAASGEVQDGADVGVGSGDVVVQLGVSADGPLHALTDASPHLGDTTPSSVLLFSPLLAASPQPQPSYPNYTLPGAQLVFPSFDLSSDSVSLNSSLDTNLTMIVIPTNSSPTAIGLDNSHCAVSALLTANTSLAGENNTILKTDEPGWMTISGEEGYRHYWVLGGDGFEAGGNYTAWVRDGSGVLSRPAWFAMKQDDFPCQLLLPTTLCPGIGYSTPLPQNTTQSLTPSGSLISNTSPLTSLPDELAEVLQANLEAFSASLTVQACGRDLYSHVSSCADCFAAYREWLCRVVVPQCGVTPTNTTTSDYDDDDDTNTTTFPLPSTLPRTPTTPRNPSLPSSLFPYSYTELLPCLGVCNAADRACPVGMGVRCPKRKVNAAESYAFVGRGHDWGDGSGGEQGWESGNRWGARWCNG